MLPPPKVEREFPGVEFQVLVYIRLSHAVLEPGPKDTLYCIVHGLYRNRERLFSQNRANNPLCPVPECQGAVQDREHIFCSCTRVVEAWLWLRSRLLQLLPRTIGAVGTSNKEFLLLQYPKDTQDKECVWLIGNYAEAVDNVTIGKNYWKEQEIGGGPTTGYPARPASRNGQSSCHPAPERQYLVCFINVVPMKGPQIGHSVNDWVELLKAIDV